MGAFETEVHREVWDEHGNGIQIGPDRDGCGLLELREVDCSKGPSKSLRGFLPQQARLVAHAMLKCADELDPPKEVTIRG